jgi:hypothetical protein
MAQVHMLRFGPTRAYEGDRIYEGYVMLLMIILCCYSMGECPSDFGANIL